MKPLKCYVRTVKNETNNQDFTTLEIDVPDETENNDEKNILYQLKHLNEIFNASFANNYVVLISSSPQITLPEINASTYNKGIAFLGLLNSKDKTNCAEFPKVLTTKDSISVKQIFNKEWNLCYLRPVLKIVTFLR